jgi:hypothetical protein
MILEYRRHKRHQNKAMNEKNDINFYADLHDRKHNI